MIRTLLFCWLTACFAGKVTAQQNAAVLEYINSYKQLAMEEMQRTGVPAAIKLAQGIHETEAGRSDLVLRSNNHFGIKCKSNWTGAKVYHDDDARGECFRSYGAALDSYRDHSDFLKNSQRYAFLFHLDPADYKGWAYGLKKAGYATNIKYSQLLIKLIETYDLQRYSLIAMGKLPAEDEALATITPPSSTKTVQTEIIPDEVPPVSYPEGIFSINDTKVIFVKGGTSLLSVASQHQVSLARLLEFNDITQGEGDILNEDQLIFLQRKRKTGANIYHYVQPEETLYDIAQAEGIRYENILEYNHLRPGMEPAAGAKLFLREKSPGPPALASAENIQQNMQNTTRHIVRQRETLFGISRKYGVPEQKIREWNGLNGAALRTGQELIIYTN